MSVIEQLKALLFPRAAEPRKDQSGEPELFSLQMGDTYKDYWNSMARDKDTAYLGVVGLPFGQPATEESLSKHGRDSAGIIADKLAIGPKDEVLEVGVGVGRIAEHIAPRCKHFTGIDISAKMIGYAGNRLKHINNITLKAHEKSDLSLFPDQSFDKVYIQVVLIHLDREDAFHYIREAFRVLRPGGLAWFQFYNLLHPNGFKEFRFAADFAVQHGGKLRGRVKCHTAPEVRKFVSEAGFEMLEENSHLSLERQEFDFDIPDTDWEYYLIAVARKPEAGP